MIKPSFTFVMKFKLVDLFLLALVVPVVTGFVLRDSNRGMIDFDTSGRLQAKPPVTEIYGQVD